MYARRCRHERGGQSLRPFHRCQSLFLSGSVDMSRNNLVVANSKPLSVSETRPCLEVSIVGVRDEAPIASTGEWCSFCCFLAKHLKVATSVAPIHRAINEQTIF